MRCLIAFLCIILLSNCSREKTDKILLELDQKKLEENINYDKIVFYKFAKIAVRSTAVEDTTIAEYQKFSKQTQSVLRAMKSINPNSKESISVIDALLMYREYRTVKSFVKATDEDLFPPLSNGFIAMYTGLKSSKTIIPEMSKAHFQNVEHAVLSMAVLTTRDLGQPFALYECSKTQPELLDDCEIKTLLEFVRGFLFFSNNLYYLSEDGISRNIKWLNKNHNIPLPYTKAFFGWGNLSDAQTHTAFHGINHLFRGLDRLRMERKIDEERSLEDFEDFLKDMDKLGLQNELVWAVQSYLYLKKESPEKAIPALTKLKASPLFSESEREVFDQTIGYVKDRKSDVALKGVYDKAFMGKMASKYMFSILSKVNWEKVMQDQGVPHAKEIFGGINKFNELSNSVSSYTQPSAIDKGKKEITKQGTELLEKAKGFWK